MTSIYLESLCTVLHQQDLEVSLFPPLNKDFKQKPTIKINNTTSWRQQKETIVNSDKGFVRPVLEYACPSPVWNPVAANTHIEKLQTVQNIAVRVATGCTNMTAIQHLHDKCQVLPLR